MDYTVEHYHKYNGEQWIILQNGEKIIIAKRSTVLRLAEDEYTLLYDSEGKFKEVSYNISDVDIIGISKNPILKPLKNKELIKGKLPLVHRVGKI